MWKECTHMWWTYKGENQYLMCNMNQNEVDIDKWQNIYVYFFYFLI